MPRGALPPQDRVSGWVPVTVWFPLWVSLRKELGELLAAAAALAPQPHLAQSHSVPPGDSGCREPP